MKGSLYVTGAQAVLDLEIVWLDAGLEQLTTEVPFSFGLEGNSLECSLTKHKHLF